MKKEIGFLCDACEFVTLDLIEAVEKFREQYEVVGIGVHSDEFFRKIMGRPPVKPYKERARMANAIKGVDYVFELTSEKLGIPKKELPLYEEDETEKRYHVAYAPGTYDLFHEGHLQHLLEVRSVCDILVVGVNSDKLVYENKKKSTQMAQEYRMKVVENLKFVDFVYLVETNDKKMANDWVREQVGSPIDVIFVGTDLKNQDFHNPEGIPILFTERDPFLMQKRSSTYYREQLRKLRES